MNIFRTFARWIWCAWQNHPYTYSTTREWLRGADGEHVAVYRNQCHNCNGVWYEDGDECEDIES
jgi:hypothetical protein